MASLDGENSGPADSLPIGDGLWAHSHWGDLAYQLVETAGYRWVENEDKTHVARAPRASAGCSAASRR